jgi:hypothetical protein
MLADYDGGALGCIPDSGFAGFTGECCISMHCYTPDAGESCIVPRTDYPIQPELSAAFGGFLSFPTGSGICFCRQNPTGPHARGTGPVHDEGSCCYVWGQQDCLGRPLLSEGEMIVAELTQRDDWLA